MKVEPIVYGDRKVYSVAAFNPGSPSGSSGCPRSATVSMVWWCRGNPALVGIMDSSLCLSSPTDARRPFVSQNGDMRADFTATVSISSRHSFGGGGAAVAPHHHHHQPD
jgi:hypothetical protein